MGQGRARKVQKRKAKKKSGSRQRKASVEARGPLVMCRVSADWDQPGGAVILLMGWGGTYRVQPLSVLVDRGCLGVRDVILGEPMPLRELEEFAEQLSGPIGSEEISLGLAVALIDESVAFAHALGFPPPKAFRAARKLIGDVQPTPEELSRATPGGPGGRPLYSPRQGHDTARIVAKLTKAVGPEGFDVAGSLGGDPLDGFVERPLGAELSTDEVALSGSAGRIGLERRLIRMGAIKRALVEYAGSDDFADAREEFLEEEVHRALVLESADKALDAFIYWSDGLIEQFVDDFALALSEREAAAVLAWRGRFYSVLEIQRVNKDHVRALDLATELPVRVRSNMGNAFLSDLPDEGILTGRFVPFEDGVLLSGPQTIRPLEDKPSLLRSLARMCQGAPRFLLRNPELLASSWAHQRLQHEVFIEEFGDPVVEASEGPSPSCCIG